MNKYQKGTKGNNLVNILVDFAFKKVFAGEGEISKHLLIDFLNCILELEEHKKIKEIVYINPFNDRETSEDKQSIMDIKVKTECDELVDIEVQISDVDDYKKRSLYYWSKLYGESIKKGNAYYDLKKSIVVNILDFNLIKENDKYHNVFVIKEKDDNFVFIEDLEIHYIELNKFNFDKDINSLNDLEEWLVFLKECGPNGDEEVIEKLSVKKEEIGVAVEIMNKLSADEIEYQKYLAREKFLLDEISKKKYAEYKMNQIKEELNDMMMKKQQAEEDRIKAEEEKKKAEEEKKKAEEEKKKAEEDKIKSDEERIRSEEFIREMLFMQLKLKFVDLSEVYEEKIKNLSIDKVKEISMEVLAIKDLKQLEKYFNN